MISTLYNIYKQHPIITTDSRNCPEGSIFFALKGERCDGNKFAADTLAKGCAYAVVDDVYGEDALEVIDFEENKKYIHLELKKLMKWIIFMN